MHFHHLRPERAAALCIALLLVQPLFALTKTSADDTGTNDDPEKFRHTYSSTLSKATPTPDTLTHSSVFDDCVILRGIDVSKYQSTIDWTAVANDDVDYAIIRLGYRGYGSAGTLAMDNMYETNITGATAAGLDVGVYFFTQALNVTEAVAEANYVLEHVKGYDLSCPIYIDIEDITYASGRMDNANLTNAEYTAICDAFCSTIEAAGYRAGVYANKYWLTSKLDAASLAAKYEIWLANYTTQTTYTGTYQSWQYTSQGSVSGISGNVDLDVRYSRRLSYAQSSLVLTDPDASASPTLTGDGKITYSSSDSSVASVDANGVIRPVGNGTATVTAASDNGTSASIAVTVTAFTNLKLSSNVTLFSNIGETAALSAVSGSAETWTSSDEQVVSVSTDGVITATGYGTAEVEAVDAGGNSAVCTVLVTDKELRLGDTNMDGSVDALDAADILYHAALVGAGSTDATLSAVAYYLSDMNQDDTVDAVDATAVLILSAQEGVGITE